MEEHNLENDLVLNNNNAHISNNEEIVTESITSLIENHSSSQKVLIDNLPIDYAFSGSETVESYVFQDDYILDDFISNIDGESNSFRWIQDSVPESNTTPQKIDALIDTINCSEAVEFSNNLQDGGTFIEHYNEAASNSPETEKTLTRKRKRQPNKWKSNVAKINRQSGKPYTTKKGLMKPGRSVKYIGCFNQLTCSFKCMSKIDMVGRQAVYDLYWALNDSEKRNFYASNIKRVSCLRKRTKAEHSRKSYSLHYYFNYMKTDIRVCQQFFVNTLNVNKGRVYYFFSQTENRSTITPGPHKHGKHTKKVLSEQLKQGVGDHINKFPAIESHYCREGTKKKFFGS